MLYGEVYLMPPMCQLTLFNASLSLLHAVSGGQLVSLVWVSVKLHYHMGLDRREKV